ncbi:hypothetical protein L7F22_039974 [Adiantum nelumboides]|nr:hypothetical protein [Adiantum nelumboides]
MSRLSRQQAWLDPKTGTSPSFWGQAVGSYFMALVDTLDFFPSTHVAKRDDLVAILHQLVEAVAKVQDPATGVCRWEVLDQGGWHSNYLESSVFCIFIYGLPVKIATVVSRRQTTLCCRC